MKNKLIIVTLSLLGIVASGSADDPRSTVEIEEIFVKEKKESFRLLSGEEVELNIPPNEAFGKLKRKNEQQIEEILFITKTKKDGTEEKEYIDVNITREDLDHLKAHGSLTCLSTDYARVVSLFDRQLIISDVSSDKAYALYAWIKKLFNNNSGFVYYFNNGSFYSRLHELITNYNKHRMLDPLPDAPQPITLKEIDPNILDVLNDAFKNITNLELSKCSKELVVHASNYILGNLIDSYNVYYNTVRRYNCYALNEEDPEEFDEVKSNTIFRKDFIEKIDFLRDGLELFYKNFIQYFVNDISESYNFQKDFYEKLTNIRYFWSVFYGRWLNAKNKIVNARDKYIRALKELDTDTTKTYEYLNIMEEYRKRFQSGLDVRTLKQLLDKYEELCWDYFTELRRFEDEIALFNKIVLKSIFGKNYNPNNINDFLSKNYRKALAAY